jgi:hypothetical protein
MISNEELLKQALEIAFQAQLTHRDEDLYQTLVDKYGVTTLSREKLGILKLIANALGKIKKQPFSQVGGILNVLEGADPLAILDLLRDPQNALNGDARNAVHNAVRPYVQAVAILLYMLDVVLVDYPTLNVGATWNGAITAPILGPYGRLQAMPSNAIAFKNSGTTTAFRMMNDTTPNARNITFPATTGNKLFFLQTDDGAAGPVFSYSINGGAAVAIPQSPGVFFSTPYSVVISCTANGNLNSVSGTVSYSKPLVKFWDLIGLDYPEQIPDVKSNLLMKNPIFQSIYQNINGYSVDDQNAAMASFQNVITGLTSMAIPAASAAALSSCIIYPEYFFSGSMVQYAGSVANLQTLAKLAVVYHLMATIVPDTLELIVAGPSSSGRLY